MRDYFWDCVGRDEYFIEMVKRCSHDLSVIETKVVYEPIEDEL